MEQYLNELLQELASGKIISEKEAISIQKQLLSYADFGHSLDWDTLGIVAGADLAYWMQEGTEYGVCSIVLLDYRTREVIESCSEYGEIYFPYLPGCLSFREMPLIIKAQKKLKHIPDVYMFDGNGYLHPRHMGIATHAGICLNCATIGVAKSFYKFTDTEFEMPENLPGAYQDVRIDGEVYGRVLRTHQDVRPVFVSAGNRTSLEDAARLTSYFITPESHIPLPTRLADLETHKMRAYYQSLQLNED